MSDDSEIASKPKHNHVTNSLCKLLTELVSPNESKCEVPKYAPYIWVVDSTNSKIHFEIFHPNDSQTVDGYMLYYWGLRKGVNSTIE